MQFVTSQCTIWSKERGCSYEDSIESIGTAVVVHCNCCLYPGKFDHQHFLLCDRSVAPGDCRLLHLLHRKGTVDLLYKLFGINAELLIDHAWGWEPCTIAEVKQYKPESNSVGSGQVLHCPYDFEKARLIVREMIDLLVLDLVDKGMVTDQIVLTVGYDIENLSDPVRRKAYKGQITTDRYGRQVPKHAHGTANIGRYTSSTRLVTDAVLELYDRIVDKSLLVRRLNISANHVICEADVPKENKVEQLDLFTDYAALEKEKEKEDAALEREKKMQQAVLTIKKKFGKNAILKGMNLQEGATAKDRNSYCF